MKIASICMARLSILSCNKDILGDTLPLNSNQSLLEKTVKSMSTYYSITRDETWWQLKDQVYHKNTGKKKKTMLQIKGQSAPYTII